MYVRCRAAESRDVRPHEASPTWQHEDKAQIQTPNACFRRSLCPRPRSRTTASIAIRTRKPISGVYFESQAPEESVEHVEKVKEEVVLGTTYEIWDVTTDKNRWWVITSPTNLYSQKSFPSLDFTLLFHIGLMMRVMAKPEGARSQEPTPFDEVFRRQEQAKDRYDHAKEPEDFQAIGMQLRECLLSLLVALRRHSSQDFGSERPQDANFVEWSALLMDRLCAGSRNKEIRRHLKNSAKDTWQLVNWLTHDRDADSTAASIAIHACDTVVGHFVQILERSRLDGPEECPLCKSRHVRSHFDPLIEPDGDYFSSCAKCDWSDHPSAV